MKNKRECKIIQEYLLPNYIDNLTDEEINSYINEHIKECDNCKKVYEDMQKDSKEENMNQKQNEINYMRKFNTKLKIVKSIFILIFAIILLILSLTIRKMIILNNLNEKVTKYIESKNTYVRISGNLNTGYEYMEIYKKDDKIKRILKMENKEVYSTTIETPDEMSTYMDTPEHKQLSTTNDMIYNEQIISRPIYYEGTLKEKFLIAFFTKIESERVDGKDCYVLSTWRKNGLPDSYGGYIGKAYIEKNTGLILKYVEYQKEKELMTYYEYKFNENTDEDMKEPDMSQYEVLESN